MSKNVVDEGCQALRQCAGHVSRRQYSVQFEQAKAEGMVLGRSGACETANPYEFNTDGYWGWALGWEQGHETWLWHGPCRVDGRGQTAVKTVTEYLGDQVGKDGR